MSLIAPAARIEQAGAMASRVSARSAGARGPSGANTPKMSKDGGSRRPVEAETLADACHVFHLLAPLLNKRIGWLTLEAQKGNFPFACEDVSTCHLVTGTARVLMAVTTLQILTQRTEHSLLLDLPLATKRRKGRRGGVSDWGGLGVFGDPRSPFA